MFDKYLDDLCTWLSRNFRPDYQAYLRSWRWRLISNAAKARAGWRCQGCNRPKGIVQLESHHRTYERLGFERPGDLTVFCGDCHEAVTLIIRHVRSGTIDQVKITAQKKTW